MSLKALGALAMASAMATGSLAAKRPNVVVFIVDDMGWQDTSVPFHTSRTPLNDKYCTPNMERLAAEGMLFTNAYGAPVCSPSRISLMTGANATRHRVTNWTLYKNKDTSEDYKNLTSPTWNMNGMSLEPCENAYCAPSLPNELRNNGYRTIIVGKSHLGAVDTPGAEPRNLGFDVNVGGHAAGGPGSYLPEHEFSARWRGGDGVWDIPHLGEHAKKGEFLTEALTHEANKAIDDAVFDQKPFFLYFSHYAVHVPFEPDNRYMAKYLSRGLDKTEAMYAALVEGMDASLGSVMDNLKRHGVENDTIVVFLSDNGGLAAHGRTAPLNTQNAPLRSGKGSAYEGGIRVPMIVKWPGVSKPSSRCDVPVIVEDLFPTLMSMVGSGDVKQLKKRWDGRDISPLLRSRGKFDVNRPLFWHYPNYWGVAGLGVQPFSAVRVGSFKLIYFYQEARFELYDLSKDIGEEHDLAQAMPEKVRSLCAVLMKQLRKVKAQTPVNKATGKALPYPSPQQSLLDFSLNAWKHDKEMRIQDAYKWLYHATLGGEHAVTSDEGPRRWMDAEWPTLREPFKNEPLMVKLRPDGKLIRVNLRPFRAVGGDKEKLLQAFVASAKEFHADRSEFVREWSALGTFLKAKGKQGLLSYVGWQKLDAEAKKQGYPAIDHSPEYEKAAKPAYRVMLASVWEKMEKGK